MYKKILLTSWLSLYLLSSVSFAGNIKQAQAGIIAQIKSGRMESAADSIDKFVADNPQSPEISNALYEITENYGWSNKYEEEKNVYQRIIQKYPDSLIANKARLGYSKAEIQSLIILKKFDEAKAAFAELSADFAGHTDLPMAYYRIAERYGYADKREEEKDIYQQIIRKYPDSSYANKARLGYSSAEVRSLIVSRNYDEAKKAADKLIADFKGHPDLPDTIYRIARIYGWSHKYEEEKGLYRLIVQAHLPCSPSNYPELGYSRAEVHSLIMSGEYDHAGTAFNKLVADFAGHPDLPDTLNAVAKRWVWAGNYQEAKNVYQQIVNRYPGSVYSAKAQTYIQITDRGINLFSLIDAEKTKEAQEKMDRLVRDFNGHDLLPQTVMLCGERYSARAFQKRSDGLAAESKEDFTRAIGIWKKIIEELPASTTTPYAYYHSAICYGELGEYEKAAEHFKKVVGSYPNFEMAWDAQFRVGYTYEKMLRAGLISESQGKPLIASAYKEIMEKYPDCKAAKLAKKWLDLNGN